MKQPRAPLVAVPIQRTESGTMRRLALIMALAALVASSAAHARPAQVALSFDDVPGATLLESQAYVDYINVKLLARLRKNHLPATGFVNEGKLDELNRVHQIRNLRRWLAAGMELGNHTYSHESPNTLGPDAYIADIERGARVTGALLRRRHQSLQWFRHPYLETGSPRSVREQIDQWLAKHGYRTAPVTMNAEDWEFAAVYDDAIAHHDKVRRNLIRDQYLRHLERSIAWDRRAAMALFGRDIAYVLLLHATRLSADCMDEVAALLRRDGLQPVSLAHAMTDPAYRVPDDYSGSDGIDWLERWSLRTDKELPWDDFPEVPPLVQQQYDQLEHDRGS
jgi:peptidoglycan/xylan/chitin deacetylase (PgdA/CDA1 family)